MGNVGARREELRISIKTLLASPEPSIRSWARLNGPVILQPAFSASPLHPKNRPYEARGLLLFGWGSKAEEFVGFRAA